MTTFYITGIDPGPTTGIVKLFWDGAKLHALETVQCNALAAMSIIGLLVQNNGIYHTHVALERFIDSRRSGRGKTPRAAQVTRDMVTNVLDFYAGLSYVTVTCRTASEVKPWANDERLHRIGLWSATKGMTHARDAARHALFGAVKLGVPDPISKYYAQAGVR